MSKKKLSGRYTGPKRVGLKTILPEHLATKTLSKTLAPKTLASTSVPYPSALVRWDGEGGAGPNGPQKEPDVAAIHPLNKTLPEVKFASIHSRVIALENLVIALLAHASTAQIEAAHEVAQWIAPRPSSTQHPLTIHATAHMSDLLARSTRLPHVVARQ